MKLARSHYRLLLAGTLALGLAQITAPTHAGDIAWSGFAENATYFRKDAGLSKFRNGFQLEGLKDIGQVGPFRGVSINGIFRVSHDGVYQLNDDEYGDKAGGPIQLQNFLIGPPSVPHGGGIINYDTAQLPPFNLPPTNNFGFDTGINPNEGLAVLGSHLHSADGGVTFGVPVRPCDKDSRGCINDYMDADEDELASPELFGDRLDFIRELYVDFSLPVGQDDILGFRLGKQQIVWGRTDLFRVLDIINPVDFSRNNIYDELEDIRIPMWMLRTDLRLGATGIFDDLNFQLVWNFDKFRPNNLGQCGTPNVILDAGCLFRGMRNLWENGGTVSNFGGGFLATDFGPHVIGLRDVNMPSWSLSNTQFGFKVEGVLQDFGWSLNAMNYRSQLPSLRGGRVPAINPFLGEEFPADTIFPGHPGESGAAPRDYLIAFDMYFPRVTLLGGSIDYFSQAIDTVFRIETAWTEGEEFANTSEERLYSESNVFRFVVGADKNIFIRSINRTRAFLFSAQIFGQHLLDHEDHTTELTGLNHPVTGSPFLKTGMPDWKENWIATLLVKGWWLNDRLSPQVIMAHDFRAHASAIAPSIEWLIDDHWKVTAGFNIKFGRDYTSGSFKYDDTRSANPFFPFSAYTPEGLGALAGDDIAATHLAGAQSLGMAGYEPLGRFRAGPIGMAQKEDEFQLTVQYRF